MTDICRIDAAVMLFRLKTNILTEWEKRARDRVRAAKKQRRLALRDSLPEFIHQLIENLKSIEVDKSEVRCLKFASDHAEDGAKQPEYSIVSFIHKCHILRR